MKKNIELFLISGFLGSGKTTFLQKLLYNLEGIKIGVIVNEFGSTGIDGTLIDKEGIQLVEINNGSIYCSCIKGNFIKTLIEFTTKDIDILLIENSGMADPSNIHQIMEEVSFKATRKLDYKGAVCILDAVSFLKHIRVLAPVQNQVASSNFIVVNKIDLVNQTVIEEIHGVIREINPRAYVYETIYSEIPAALLKDKLSDNGFVGETSNKCYNRPACYSIEGEGDYTEQGMREFIQKMNKYILRLKGFLKGNNLWWKVDVVDGQVEIVEAVFGKRDRLEKTKLVIIGHDTNEFRQEIEEAWKEIFRDTPVIFE